VQTSHEYVNNVRMCPLSVQSDLFSYFKKTLLIGSKLRLCTSLQNNQNLLIFQCWHWVYHSITSRTALCLYDLISMIEVTCALYVVIIQLVHDLKPLSVTTDTTCDVVWPVLHTEKSWKTYEQFVNFNVWRMHILVTIILRTLRHSVIASSSTHHH
jgi:hypothetical protein